MSANIRIAVDAMSGDLGPRVAISAVKKFTAKFSDVDVLLVGDQQQLLKFISAKSLAKHRITIFHAADVVAMNEDPLQALRHKKNSSMWLSLDALNNNLADACVSAGNTGALLAISKYLLKTFPGVDRPAICKSIPVENGLTYVLDLGANIHCSAVQLYQFALMGHVLASAQNKSPRIALLNIGTEATKGTDVIQSAQQLIQQNSHLNYCGFVEATSIFSGDVNVIVCDGFHGNIALKTLEGTARFIVRKFQMLFKKNWLTRLLGFILWPWLKELRNDLDPSMHNGAFFLGLQKIVIKSHGNANKKAFFQSLIVAREQVLQKVPERIHQEFLYQSNLHPQN